MQIARRLLAIVVVQALGCAEQAPVPYLARYELDGVQLLSYDYSIICRGLQDRIEMENARIGAAINAPENSAILLAYGKSALGQLCIPELPNGCTHHDGESIVSVADDRGITHELVHAHRLQRKDWRKPPFLEEGLAERLSVGSLRGYYSTASARTTDLTTAFELHQLDLHTQEYRDAGHLVNWMFDAFGEEATLSAYADPVSATTALTSDLGVETLSELEQRWHDETEEVIEIGSLCQGDPVYSFKAGEINAEFDLACESPGVLGPDEVDGVLTTWREFCFDVDVTGPIRVELLSPSEEVTLQLFPYRMGRECPPPPDRPAAKSDKEVDVGSAEEFDFVACRWRALLRAGLETPTTARVRLTLGG